GRSGSVARVSPPELSGFRKIVTAAPRDTGVVGRALAVPAKQHPLEEVMYVARAIGFAKFDRERRRTRRERHLRLDPDPPQHARRTRFGLPAGREFLRRNLIRDLQGQDARRSVPARWARIRVVWRVGTFAVQPHAAELAAASRERILSDGNPHASLGSLVRYPQQHQGDRRTAGCAWLLARNQDQVQSDVRELHRLAHCAGPEYCATPVSQRRSLMCEQRSSHPDKGPLTVSANGNDMSASGSIAELQHAST